MGQAIRYGTGDIPTLLAQLDNHDQDVSISTVVETLGIIGDVRAIQPLIAFIERGEGELSDDFYGAKKGVLFALGHIAAQTRSPEQTAS